MKSSSEVKEAATLAERDRIIQLLTAKELGCPCGCGHWMNADPVIALIKGENK